MHEVQNDITLQPEKWMWNNQNDAKKKKLSQVHINQMKSFEKDEMNLWNYVLH